jgi:tetratricopeptide (TPR) repeat protein
MVREMRELMDRYTAHRPLVFVLEDLHWSDQGTLRMMEHFARRPREVRILWLASFRLTQVIAEDHPLHHLRQELRVHRLCDEILLEPFSEREVSAYMQDRLAGTSVPEDFVRRLHAHTDGLPLFVANVADALLAESAGDEGEMARWLAASSTAPLPVPDSLAGVIEVQIGRLPADVQTMLEAASVCGVEFRAGIVANMTGRDARWVSERCDDLVKRRFWLRHVDIVELPDGEFDTRYSFLHALYQHVFYHRLSLPQRIQLHRQAAKTMEAMPPSAQAAPAAELASHHERGHQILQALRYYGIAAELAVGHFAPAEAINLTGKALKLLDRCPDGVPRREAELTLVHKRGIACGQLLGIGAQETVAMFERARQLCEMLPDTPERSLLLNGLGLTRYVQGDYAQARAFTERVLVQARHFGDDLVLRMISLLLGGMVDALEAKHEVAVAKFEEALLARTALGERAASMQFVVDPIVSIHANLAMPLMYLARPDEARLHVEHAHERAHQLGQPTAIMLAFWVRALVELRCGHPQRVLDCVTALGRIVHRDMVTQADGPAHWLRGWAITQLGSPREGFAEIRDGFDRHARLGMYAGNTEPLGHAAEALLLAGDLTGAETQLDEAFQLSRRLGEVMELPRLLLLRGQLALARGDRAGAQASMRAAVAESRARKSPYHELKLLIALCEQPAAPRSDFDELRAVHATLKSGLDMAAEVRAAQLLGH